MKIAFLTDEDVGRDSGVTQKIRSQVSSWTKLGADVQVFSMYSSESISWDCKVYSANKKLKTEGSSLFTKYCKYKLDMSLIVNEIITFDPDVIYTRYVKYVPILEQLKDYCIVTEVNINEKKEYFIHGFLKGLFNLYSRRKFYTLCNGAVFIAENLHDTFDQRVLKRKGVTIGNAIQYESDFDPLGYELDKCNNIVMIGSAGQPWQGFDLCIELAKLMPQYTFDIIGPNKKELSKVYPGKTPENVIVHGFLSVNKMDVILRKSRLALGALRKYQLKMSQSSDLKVRLYVKYGIPVVLTCPDVDFMKENSYILNLNSQNTSPENLVESINNFIIATENITRETIFNLGKEIISADIKEVKRLAYMKKIKADS